MESRIKSERALKGISQEKLAFEIGVSQMMISKWEKNIGRCPVDKALKMCNVFGCSLAYLVGDTETRC
jgi:transcriptional regulator with XRE-family HTH domain